MQQKYTHKAPGSELIPHESLYTESLLRGFKTLMNETRRCVHITDMHFKYMNNKNVHTIFSLNNTINADESCTVLF